MNKIYQCTECGYITTLYGEGQCDKCKTMDSLIESGSVWDDEEGFYQNPSNLPYEEWEKYLD